MRPTIRNIAEASGVSRGTVDKVLNNRIGVSDAVRERVKQVAERLGYRPNPAGKALAFQKKPITLGVIFLSPENVIFKMLRKGAEAAGEEFADFGLKLEFIVMDRVAPEEQLRCLDVLKQKGISGLILSPLQDPRIAESLSKLIESGTPVITTNTDLPDSARLCFVGQNLVQSGRVAGELMGGLLPIRSKIAILSGQPTIKALKERIAGFLANITERHSQLTVVQIVEDVDGDASGFDRTMEICRNHPDIDGLYITGLGIKGACDALKTLQLDRVRVICFDAQPETLALLKEKRVDFTITQDPYQQGYKPVHLLYEYFFANKTPIRTCYHTQLKILTCENWESES